MICNVKATEARSDQSLAFPDVSQGNANAANVLHWKNNNKNMLWHHLTCFFKVKVIILIVKLGLVIQSKRN